MVLSKHEEVQILKSINNIMIIGGDSRQSYMADFLEKSDFNITVYGLKTKDRTCIKNFKSEIEKTDAVILPLPISKDGKNIISSEPIKETLDDIIFKTGKNCIVFGGLIDRSTESKLVKKGIRYFDYYKREDVTIKNTVPTVQGILKAIIDNVDYTIHSSKCAVFGYGRVGKITADILSSIGADITVCARKKSDLTTAEMKKLNGCLIEEFYIISKNYDIIINTIPSVVIDRKILENLKSDCLIIDVASSPFGTDFACANELGIRAIQCPSIPGKVAPKTAGIIIAQAITDIIKEENL